MGVEWALSGRGCRQIVGVGITGVGTGSIGRAPIGVTAKDQRFRLIERNANCAGEVCKWSGLPWELGLQRGNFDFQEGRVDTVVRVQSGLGVGEPAQFLVGKGRMPRGIELLIGLMTYFGDGCEPVESGGSECSGLSKPSIVSVRDQEDGIDLFLEGLLPAVAVSSSIGPVGGVSHGAKFAGRRHSEFAIAIE